MAGKKRRGFIGWLSEAFQGTEKPAEAVPVSAGAKAVTATPAVTTSETDISSENAPPPVKKAQERESSPFEDLIFDEESTFVPPPRVSKLTPPERGLSRPARAVRPPGAIAAFETTCMRCTRCVEACPFDAIHLGPDGFPTLTPHRTPCQLCVDVPCAAVCPEGALLPIMASEIRLGTVVVMTSLCLNNWSGDSCDRCYDQCPVPGSLIVGSRGIPEVNAALCVGCGLCARSCPADPQAMMVKPLSADHHPRGPERAKA